MDWPKPWGPIDDNSAAQSFEAELQRELCPGHLLFGLPLRAIGRRWDCDDVLFMVEDGSRRVAAVHLTWKHRAEQPPWPIAGLYESFSAWGEKARGGRDDK